MTSPLPSLPHKSHDCLMNMLKSGAYLAIHESQNFGDDNPEKGSTPNIENSKFTDLDKQIE